MRKHRLLLPFCILLLWLPARLAAQQSMQEILEALKDPRTPATTVDALLPQLIALEKKQIVSPDSQQLALDIFLNASYAYARNFHFKQGLLVYKGYLGLKDKFALHDKSEAVRDLLAKNQDRRKALDEEITQRKSETVQLASDTVYWEKMNSRFSRNYSLIVILFTAVLALVLIRINMQTVKARHTLEANRARMLEMQRLSALGRFYPGAFALFRSSSKELQEKSAVLSETPGKTLGLPSELQS